MTLFELTGELLDLLDMAEQEDIDEEALQGSWEAVEMEFDDKVEGWCKVIKSLEATADALKNEEKRLKAKRDTLENRIKWMKEAVRRALEAVGKKKAGGDIFTASIRPNGGKLPLVLDVDEDKVPFEFQKVAVSANKDAIRDALDSGRTLDFAHYGERGESLQIK